MQDSDDSAGDQTDRNLSVLIDSLIAKDAAVLALRHANARLEAESELAAASLERRRAELQALRGKLGDARRRHTIAPPSEHLELLSELQAERRATGALVREYENARDEIAALHSSASWRITAPLRFCYRVVTRLLGRSAS